MNRNWLKTIAVVSMLIDHIGAVFFPSIWWLRLIGRLAFPIFAFFIAEGYHYTKSRKNYVLSLLICAVISQVPYMFLHNYYNFNVIFTFLLAILCIYLIETHEKYPYLKTISLTLILAGLVVVDPFGFFDYGICGVLLTMIFYFARENKTKRLVYGLIILITFGLIRFAYGYFEPRALLQMFATVSILLLWTYNGEKGKLNLKWMFYVFYPLHLAIIYLITLI